MLTDEKLQARIAQAFHDQADPVTRTVIDAAPIWRKATRDPRGRSLFTAPSVTMSGSAVWGRLVAAAASAAAVALLVSGVWLVTHRTTGAPEPAVATRGDRPPPFYVELAGDLLDVRSSTTGKLLARATLPNGFGIAPEMTVAGNDSRFVIAESLNTERVFFYELYIPRARHPVRLTSLPIVLPGGSSRYQLVTSLAVSPNGSELAIAIGQDIDLVTLPAGTVQRTWTMPGSLTVGDLSWADEGSELGFGSTTSSQNSSSWAYFTLNVKSPGNNLASARQVVPAEIGGKAVAGALLSPDGNVVVLLLNAKATRAYLVEVSARTGRPVRTLLTFPYSQSNYADLSIVGWNADGSQLLLDMNSSSLGWLDGNHYSQLPGSSPLLHFPEPADAW